MDSGSSYSKDYENRVDFAFCEFPSYKKESSKRLNSGDNVLFCLSRSASAVCFNRVSFVDLGIESY